MRMQCNKNRAQKKCLSFVVGVFVVSTVSLHAAPAFALFEFFDRVFVFREDQKELVAPKRRVAPKHVIVPHYNTEDSGDWARFNTRDDLKPIEYMDNSSMVMRGPDLPDRSIEEAKWHAGTIPYQQAKQQQPAQVYQQPYAHYPMGYGPMAPPPGYQAMMWRHYANQQLMNRRQHVYIGEPGSAPGRPIENRSNVSVKTKIGDPAPRWDDAPKHFNDAVAPRPGDYNYQRTQRQPAAAQEQIQQRAVPQQPVTPQNYGNEPGQVIIDSAHGRAYPNNYIVQNGDSLSSISEQDQIYGDWSLWPLIFDANQQQIDDPDLIYPQQNLDIPRGYTPNDENGARQRAHEKTPPYSFYDYR